MAQKVTAQDRTVQKTSLVITLLLERSVSDNLDLPDQLTPETKVNAAQCVPVVARAFHLNSFKLPERQLMRIEEIAELIPADHVDHYNPPKPGRYRI